MITKKFELRFASEVKLVNDIIKDALVFIEKTIPCLTSAEKTDIRLIFSELLFNAVIHGNKYDLKKQVYLCIEVCENAIKSTITDEGPGFDYTKLMTSFTLDNAFDDISIYESENGRGIRLALALTDEFSYNSYGNEIYFYKRVASHG